MKTLGDDSAVAGGARSTRLGTLRRPSTDRLVRCWARAVDGLLLQVGTQPVAPCWAEVGHQPGDEGVASRKSKALRCPACCLRHAEQRRAIRDTIDQARGFRPSERDSASSCPVDGGRSNVFRLGQLRARGIPPWDGRETLGARLCSRFQGHA